MNRAIECAKEKEHDFIGEVANELDSYREVFTYLKDKYKEVKPLLKRLNQICESNCFSHGKKGDIIPSLAIINLKSNHGWTDRNDITTKDDKLSTPPPIQFVDTDNGD